MKCSIEGSVGIKPVVSIADIVLLNKTIEILCDCCKLSYNTIS